MSQLALNSPPATAAPSAATVARPPLLVAAGDGASARATPRHVVAVGLGFTVALLGLWLGRSLFGQVAETYALADPSRPALTVVQVGVLYLATPLIALCAIAAVLSPGVLLVLTSGALRQWTELFPRALALSLVLLGGATTVVKLLTGPLRPGTFFLLVVALDVALWGWWLARVRRRAAPLHPRMDAAFLRRCGWVAALAVALLVGLLPKFFWENFNDDGVQALECGRLLSRELLPIWDPATPNMRGFPGVTTLTFLYPVHWFVEIFGPYEIAARLPQPLCLVALFFGLVNLIESGASRQLGVWAEAAIALALATFTVTLGYSASYDPYSADIAQPAARETLLMALFVPALAAYWHGAFRWFSLLALLTFMSSPSGGMLLGLMGLVTLVCDAKDRKRRLKWLAAALAACVVSAAGWGLVAGPSEHSPGAIAHRLLCWTVTDYRRLAFLVVPGGILPAIALLAFRWHDRMARLIALICLAYFAFFYAQSFVVLHYFAPAMILPIAAFWRVALSRPNLYRGLSPLAALAAAVSLWLSFPRPGSFDQTARELGLASQCHLGDYHAGYEASLQRAVGLYRKAFTPDYDIPDPSREWGGSPVCWLYYANRPKPPGTTVNLIAQPASLPAPSDFVQIAATRRDALYARSREAYEQCRYGRWQTNFAAPLYALPRTTLFKHLGEDAGAVDIDLRPLLRPYFPQASSDTDRP